MIIDRDSGKAYTEDFWTSRPQDENLHEKASQVTVAERKARFGQQPATLLLTGLTGAGKTTIAYALERRLFESGRAATVLDGENMRLGISRDLGFTARERSENLRRSAEVAKLMNEAGLITIAAFLAPSEETRHKVRDAIGADRYLEIYLSAPVEVCRQRDKSGIYARADAGEIAEVPGVSAPYDVPSSPDLVLPTHELSVKECVDRIVKLLEQKHVLST
jgi:bifunctional enzyme CysN/CysC